jgi:hypothetical protein
MHNDDEMGISAVERRQSLKAGTAMLLSTALGRVTPDARAQTSPMANASAYAFGAQDAWQRDRLPHSAAPRPQSLRSSP